MHRERIEVGLQILAMNTCPTSLLILCKNNILGFTTKPKQWQHEFRGGLVTKSDPAILLSHKTRYPEDKDKEDAWISQLGAQYMSLKKVYGEYGSSSNYGSM